MDFIFLPIFLLYLLMDNITIKHNVEAIIDVKTYLMRSMNGLIIHVKDKWQK